MVVRVVFVALLLLGLCLALSVALRGVPSSSSTAAAAARERFAEEEGEKEGEEEEEEGKEEEEEEEEEEDRGAADEVDEPEPEDGGDDGEVDSDDPDAQARMRAAAAKRRRLLRNLDDEAGEDGEEQRDSVVKPTASNIRTVLDDRGEGHGYKIVDTNDGRLGKCLLMDGKVQLCERDEYRYHEMIVHFPARYLGGGAPKRVLIVGGGDCMALREVLRYDGVQEVVVVEADTRMVSLCESHFLVDTYQNDSRVTWVRHGATRLSDIVEKLQTPENLQRFDFVVVDTKERGDLNMQLRDRTLYRDIRLLMKRDSILVKNVSEDGGQAQLDAVSSAFPFSMVYTFHSRTHESQYRMVIGSAKKLDDILDERGKARFRTSDKVPHGRFYRPERHFSHVPWHTALAPGRRPMGKFFRAAVSVASAGSSTEAPLVGKK